MCIQTKNAPIFFAGKVLRCSKQWPGAIHLGEWNTSSIYNFMQGRCFERIESCDVPTIHPHSLLERFTALTLSSPVCLRGFCTSAPSNCTTEVSWDRVTPHVVPSSVEVVCFLVKKKQVNRMIGTKAIGELQSCQLKGKTFFCKNRINAVNESRWPYPGFPYH